MIPFALIKNYASNDSLGRFVEKLRLTLTERFGCRPSNSELSSLTVKLMPSLHPARVM